MNFKEKLKNLPNAPGVYLMQDAGGKIIYIGKAASLKKRVSSYFHGGTKDVSLKNAILTTQIVKVDYLITKSENEALLLESKLIKRYQPKYNVLWRDDKSYPHLKLTLSEDFPRLFLVRKRQEKRNGNRFFGPYTEVGEVRRTLRWLQRIFPLRLCKYAFSKDEPIPENKVRSCLYYHIKQCPAPCLGKISKKEYREIVKRVILFLEGKHKQLTANLQRKMQQAAGELNFEEAKKIRDCIATIKYMAERIDFKEIQEEDLVEKIRITAGLSELKKVLNLTKVPLHIEAFDISNIFGNQAVGSLVVFERGEPKKDTYRRYKIKMVAGIDDYAMIEEVVSRRYKRILEEGGELPDLILIDGGKGQLTSALGALAPIHRGKNIAIIALAKEKEEIYRKGKSKPLILPRRSPALQLLQRVRDEAHRFALSYHKLLRKKASLPS